MGKKPFLEHFYATPRPQRGYRGSRVEIFTGKTVFRTFGGKGSRVTAETAECMNQQFVGQSSDGNRVPACGSPNSNLFFFVFTLTVL